MDREEFEVLLEEAFEAGYNDAVNEIFDESEDVYESPYEDLYAYDESKNVRNQMDRLKYKRYGDGGAYYRNGSNLDNPETNHFKAINAGKDWKNFTNQNDGGDFYRVDSRSSWGGKFSPTRGRIKSKDKMDELEVIKRNAIAKLNKKKAEATKQRETTTTTDKWGDKTYHRDSKHGHSGSWYTGDQKPRIATRNDVRYGNTYSAYTNPLKSKRGNNYYNTED